MFLRLGRDGYTRIMRYALDHAMYLRGQLIKSGKFQIMNQAQRIPVVALTIDKSVKRNHRKAATRHGSSNDRIFQAV